MKIHLIWINLYSSLILALIRKKMMTTYLSGKTL